MTLLESMWAKVSREARPHLVTVLGEPGIGKSRLVAEFERRALRDALVLHGRCLPYGEALGYWAVAMALRAASHISPDDDASTARDKLGRAAAGVIGVEPGTATDPDEIARHLALLAGLDTSADRERTAVDQRALHTSAARFFEALARRCPLCLVFEDIHWGDNALLDLIEFIAGRVQAAPLMIVAQARSELLDKRPTWGRGVRAFTSLPLEPLDESEGRELVRSLWRDRAIPGDIAVQIGRAAGGNPLFAEELVATLADRGRSSGDIPSSIKPLIQARLDVLPGDERHTLQHAAVLGKAFWEGGLRALGARGALSGLLESLERRDLVRVQARSHLRNEREYAFKHDLIRDVAYESLPRSERRALHARAFEWLTQVGGERMEELLSVLAHHAVQAGERTRALDCLTRAAERARLAAAHREEASLLAQAIELAEMLEAESDAASGAALRPSTGAPAPPTPHRALSRRDVVAELRVRRGRAFASVGLWPEARAELDTALALLPASDAAARAEVLVDLATVSFWTQDNASLTRHASEAVSLGQSLGRDELTATAMAWLAESHKIDGDLHACRELYEQAIALAGGIRTSALANSALVFYQLGRLPEAVKYGHEGVELVRARHDTPAIMWELPHLGLALSASGRYAEALGVFDDARRFGMDHEIWPLLARSVSMSVGWHLDVFDWEGAEQLAKEARALAASAGFMPSEVSAGIDLLLTYARRSDVGRAEELTGSVAAAVHGTANWHGWLWKLRLAEALAEIALARGDFAEAAALAQDAVEQSRFRGRIKYQVLGLATRGSALAALGRVNDAVADLRQALALARQLGDPALLLRSAALLLFVSGDDALVAEANSVRGRILAALPDGALRDRFKDAEAVRLVSRLAR